MPGLGGSVLPVLRKIRAIANMVFEIVGLTKSQVAPIKILMEI
jgi:hypothetical protein